MMKPDVHGYHTRFAVRKAACAITNILSNVAGAMRAAVGQTYRATLSAGQHTVVLQAQKHSGTTAKVYGTHTITYFAIAP